MSSGLRVAICVVILAFLAIGGLLGGLQEVQQSMIQDPVAAAQLAGEILPLETIAGVRAYKGLRLDKEGYYAAWFNGGQGEEVIHLVVARLPTANYRPEEDMAKGFRLEWEAGDFRENRIAPHNFHWAGGEAPGQLLVFRDSQGQERNQFVAALRDQDEVAVVMANGPADVVTAEAFQTMLNSAPAELPTIEVEHAEEPTAVNQT